jgi:hypothetical protein
MYSPLLPPILIQRFRGFPQTLQATPGILSNNPRSPTTSNVYLLIIHNNFSHLVRLYIISVAETGINPRVRLKNRKGRDHSKDLDVDGKIILDWILGKQGGKVWTGWICLRIWTGSDKPWGSIEGGEFLE